jgi:hypothetical protein
MFQRVEFPIALPGQCYFCGSATKNPYIDWGVSIEFYGALYTCEECTGSVASLLGWVPHKLHSEIVKKYTEISQENFELLIQNRALKQAIESLTTAGMIKNEPVFNTDVEPPGSVADLDSDILEDSQNSDEATRDADELLDTGKRTSDESSDDKGVDELHSDGTRIDYKLSI